MKLLILACALACASAAYNGPEHHPVINALGVPVDTPEVQHAKALHFAAKAQTYSHDGQYYPQFYSAHYPYFYNYAPYVYNKDVPAETPEVVAAKISHFAAHAEALARHRRAIYAPFAYSAPYTYPYSTYPYVSSAAYTHQF